MSEKIVLNKTVFDKNSFINTIDTSFIQTTSTTPTLQPIPSVADFFQTYQQIFYNIPAEGPINSHEYIVRVSGEYINADNLDQDLELLIAEINNLRTTNLELEQIIVEFSTSGKLNTVDSSLLNLRLAEVGTTTLEPTDNKISTPSNAPDNTSTPSNTLDNKQGGGSDGTYDPNTGKFQRAKQQQ